MKTLVVFYSFSGKTTSLAKKLVVEHNADLAEVKDSVAHGNAWAYTAGCFSALRMKPTPIQPMDTDFAAYGKILVLAPVWASMPAPAILNVFNRLPKTAEVEVYMLSASGGSKKEKVLAYLAAKGITPTAYHNVVGSNI